jgi:tRNA(fMet)-specific endonuclease VapC
MRYLDTDHTSILRGPTCERRTQLVARIQRASEMPRIPVVVTEEVMRGWLSAIAKERFVERQVFAYRELGSIFGFFANFVIVPFDENAATEFHQLQAAKVRIGTMDLKIAATALSNGATLLTANRRDFEQVPSLRIENWLD